MIDMSQFLSSLAAEPEEQRVPKATIHLRALVFGRLSDDHVLALALLFELGGLYDRAYRTDQVLQNCGGHHTTQEHALEAHLRQIGLPCFLDELTPGEVGTLITNWQERWPLLPRPFGELVQRFVRHAEAQAEVTHSLTPATRYSVH